MAFKKTIPLILCWILFLSFSSLAETSPPQQLTEIQKSLQALPKGSAERIPLIVELVKTCWRMCPSEAKEWGLQGLQLLQEFPAPEQEVELLIYLPRLYIREADYDEAQRLVNQGLSAARQLGVPQKLATIQFNQAIIYSNSSQFILAEDAYNRLFQTYKQLEHISGMASALNNMGRLNHRQQNYGKALEQYQQALALYQQEEVTHNAANTLVNIGEIYRYIGEFDNAEAAVQKALDSIDTAQFPDVHTSALSRLADIYFDTYRFAEAEQILLMSIEIVHQHNLQYVLIPHFARLALAAIEQNNLDAAARYYTSALEHLPSGDSAHNYIDLMKASASLSLARGDFQAAANALLPVVSDIKNGDVSDNKTALLEQLIEVRQSQENWQASSELLSLYLDAYKQQVQVNRESRLEEFNALYQSSEKERQIARLEASNQEKSLAVISERAARHRLLFVAILIAVALFVIIYLGIQKRKVLKIEAELLAANAEKKKRLFSEISHEFRTPLSVLKLQIESLEYDLADDPKQTYKILHSKIASINHLISDIAQLALADAGDLNLKFEKTALKSFFEHWCESVSAAPADAGLQFNYSVALSDTDVSWIDPERIKQVLNNLLSNSLRYTDAPGLISFEVQKHQGCLRFIVQDSAPGLAEDEYAQIFERLFRTETSRIQEPGGSGLGLAICHSLIAAHDGSMQATASESGGVKITVELPFKTTA